VSAVVVPFSDHGVTQQSANDGGPDIVVTTDPARTGLAQLAAGAPRAGRLYIAVFAGSQRTGGYAVGVDRIERDGDRLVVHATISAPPQGALTIQVLTSPAQLVSIDRQNASGAREAVLVDQAGTEVARRPVPQSQP
jgi:PrcB C-terminal